MGQVQSTRPSQGELGTKLAAAQRRRRANAAQERSDEPRLGALPPVGAAAYPGAPFRPHLAGPPLPPCDTERAAYVESLEMWGAPPSAELSNILSICAGLMRTKTALIALFGDKHVWVKDSVSFQVGDFPWRSSFCGWTLATEVHQALVVPNARKDTRFRDNEFVKSGQLAFYVGTPLVSSNGHRLGTLCCADPTPRDSLDEGLCAILANFAAIVVRDLERSAALRARGAEIASRGGAASPGPGAATRAGAAVLCVSLVPGRGLTVVHADDGAGALLAGAPGLQLVGRPLWSLFAAPDATRGDTEAAAAAGAPFTLRCVRLAECEAEADLSFRPVSQAGAMPGPHVAVPSFVHGRRKVAEPDATFVVTIQPRAPAAAAAAAAPRAPRGSGSSRAACGGGPGSVQKLGPASVAVAEACAVCPLPGLKIGAPLASGSYGRVFRGKYFGASVAVKVLEDGAVARRHPDSGVSLEAVLSRSLHHPGIVETFAWRIVLGDARLPPPDAALMGQSMPSMPPLRGAAAAAAAAASPADGGAATGSSGSGAGAPGSGPGAAQLNGGLIGQRSPYALRVEESVSGPIPREEQTWMVLEYCDKGCLQDAMDRGWLRTGFSSPADEPDLLAVLATAREIAAAMAYLHANDVIHGDLSAYNVLLSSSGPSAAAAGRGFAAKVSDFGLARSLDHKSRVQTATYGTITHMAPEVLESGVVSKAADVYSFGVLMWQMCVGSRPWAGMPHAAVVRAVCAEGRSLQFPTGTDEGVALLATSCMARSPYLRPSFEDVFVILGEALAPLDGGSRSGGADGAGAA